MGHTSASLAVSFVGMLLWANPQVCSRCDCFRVFVFNTKSMHSQPWSHFLGIVIQGIGYERLSTVMAAGVRHGVNDGLGKGEAR